LSHFYLCNNPLSTSREYSHQCFIVGVKIKDQQPWPATPDHDFNCSIALAQEAKAAAASLSWIRQFDIWHVKHLEPNKLRPFDEFTLKVKRRGEESCISSSSIHR